MSEILSRVSWILKNKLFKGLSSCHGTFSASVADASQELTTSPIVTIGSNPFLPPGENVFCASCSHFCWWGWNLPLWGWCDSQLLSQCYLSFPSPFPLVFVPQDLGFTALFIPWWLVRIECENWGGRKNELYLCSPPTHFSQSAPPVLHNYFIMCLFLSLNHKLLIYHSTWLTLGS